MNQLNNKDITSTLLFHGTVEEIIGDFRGGGYDGVFWTAETPDIAQTYIPSSGIYALVHKPSTYELNQTISPEGFWYEVALTMGYEAYDIDYKYNRPCGWRWRNNESPKLLDLYKYLINELGYDERKDFLEVKQTIKDKKTIILPSDYKKPGTLYIFSGKQNLNIFDITVGRESDLTDIDYHKISLFRQVQADGYDAIKIWDFAQSKNYGNVGHVSIGLFPTAFKKLQYESIPATNFDWKDDGSDFFSQTTPEYSEWLSKKVSI